MWYAIAIALYVMAGTGLAGFMAGFLQNRGLAIFLAVLLAWPIVVTLSLMGWGALQIGADLYVRGEEFGEQVRNGREVTGLNLDVAGSQTSEVIDLT